MILPRQIRFNSVYLNKDKDGEYTLFVIKDKAVKINSRDVYQVSASDKTALIDFFAYSDFKDIFDGC